MSHSKYKIPLGLEPQAKCTLPYYKNNFVIIYILHNTICKRCIFEDANVAYLKAPPRPTVGSRVFVLSLFRF